MTHEEKIAHLQQALKEAEAHLENTRVNHGLAVVSYDYIKKELERLQGS